MLSNETIKVIQIYGQKTISALIAKLNSLDAKSSGKLQSSLNYKVQVAINELQLLVYSEDYLEIIDKGRKAGKYPPIKPLLRWATTKGLGKGAAYAIQKNIYKFGIPARPFIADVVSKMSEDSNLNYIEKAYAKDVEDYISILIKEMKN